MDTQLSLFPQTFEKGKNKKLGDIEGLQFIPEYIKMNEENQLLMAIDKEPWLFDLKRRVQHYGYKYDYKARRIDISMKIGKLPDWGQEIAIRLCEDGYFDKIPDQLIINEYKIGRAHV